MGNIEAQAYVSEDGGPRLMRSVIYCRNEHGRAEHPTQKPVGIVKPLLLYSCPPSGIVLDCFAGSGTTGVVASEHGRSAILIEGKPKYAAVARRRVAHEVPLLKGAAA
jgi:site-specific DNA-methyltransferase (adenine-specific)